MAEMSARPEARLRRSFIYHHLRSAGAAFEEFGESLAALHFGNAECEEEQASRLGLADATPLERTGFRGPTALSWLRSEGIQGLEANNKAFRQARRRPGAATRSHGGAYPGRISERPLQPA